MFCILSSAFWYYRLASPGTLLSITKTMLIPWVLKHYSNRNLDEMHFSLLLGNRLQRAKKATLREKNPSLSCICVASLFLLWSLDICFLKYFALSLCPKQFYILHSWVFHLFSPLGNLNPLMVTHTDTPLPSACVVSLISCVVLGCLGPVVLLSPLVTSLRTETMSCTFLFAPVW